MRWRDANPGRKVSMMRSNQAYLVATLLLGLTLELLPSCRLVSAGPGRTPPGAHDGLAARLEPILKAHKGKVAVAVKNLKTGESFLTTPTTRCRRPA